MGKHLIVSLLIPWLPERSLCVCLKVVFCSVLKYSGEVYPFLYYILELSHLTGHFRNQSMHVGPAFDHTHNISTGFYCTSKIFLRVQGTR